MELKLVSERLFRVLNTLLVDSKSLISAVVTWPPGEVTVVGHFCAIDIETHISVVPDVSFVAFPEGNKLTGHILVWSDDGSGTFVEHFSILVGDDLFLV